MRTTRRQVMTRAAAGLASGLILPHGLRAQDVVTLDWRDLVPDGSSQVLLWETLQGIGIVEHGEYASTFTQEEASAVTTEFNGKQVRIPGYVVPLDYELAVREFILVPYIGACIHVPPPPANQLVWVTTEVPYEVPAVFAPVWVQGLFSTLATETELAEIGYALEAVSIEEYEG
ncbi:MAG: DUF3299 domain-containing protein [Rhodobacteraceae bacterium]|jgi:hypothetical protein|nr:DUF3299 domain-containing protein [Paracoccaceae bacterium]